MSEKVRLFKVEELNQYIKNILESDILLKDIWLVGEISNLKYYHNGGQIYFSLSDPNAQVNCVTYITFSGKWSFELKNGLKVAARGKIKVFQKKGSYIFQVAYMTLQGEGGQNQAFEKLKAQLLKEGLFDEARKRPIPRYPEKIALITAPNSAAMWDYVSLSKKLTPHIELYLVPAVMQGEASSYSVIEALDLANTREELDIIIISRGGGSAEDLASFNNEELVRHIAQSRLPVISAVGHEVDYTLCDFVADLRLPTPTAAAEFIAKPFAELKDKINFSLQTFGINLRREIKYKKQNIAFLMKNIKSKIGNHLALKKQKTDNLLSRLEQASPLHKMRQGFSITRLISTGKIIRSVKEIKAQDLVITELFDGKFKSEVIYTE